MVTIFVGSKKKMFVLHKKLICTEAPYFDKMFNGNFEEAKTQECHLEEEEPFAFEVFVAYVYTKHFPDDVKEVTGVLAQFEPIVKFYVLADKLLMSKEAKTAALDAFIKARVSSGMLLNEVTTRFILSQTANDCPLRKLAMDMLCRDFLTRQDYGTKWLMACLKDAPFEQTAELLRAMKGVASVKPALTEEISKKLVREKRSITSIPDYQIGYLKVAAQLAPKGLAHSPLNGW